MKSKPYYLFLFLLLLIPTGVWASDFVPLVGIPGLDIGSDGGLNSYINALYRLSISIAALLAVIKIVAAGAKYMLTDIVPAKEDAKKDIQGALIGLLIVIGAVIILNTVNSDLTRLNLKLPDQAIRQGQKIEDALRERMKTLEERAKELDSPVTKFYCETLFVNNFEIQEGETEEQACKRVCQSDLKGIYTYKIAKSSTCDYIPKIAERCDPNSNYTCCETIQDGSWYPGHNQCLTDTNSFEKSICDSRVTGTGFTRKAVTDCTEQIKECTDSGNKVISNRGGSILCTDKPQQEINDAIATQ